MSLYDKDSEIQLKEKRKQHFLFQPMFLRKRYCFKKCVSDKRKKSTDFLDLQEIKTTKTKKV